MYEKMTLRDRWYISWDKLKEEKAKNISGQKNVSALNVSETGELKDWYGSNIKFNRAFLPMDKGVSVTFIRFSGSSEYNIFTTVSIIGISQI